MGGRRGGLPLWWWPATTASSSCSVSGWYSRRGRASRVPLQFTRWAPSSPLGMFTRGGAAPASSHATPPAAAAAAPALQGGTADSPFAY